MLGVYFALLNPDTNEVKYLQPYCLSKHMHEIFWGINNTLRWLIQVCQNYSDTTIIYHMLWCFFLSAISVKSWAIFFNKNFMIHFTLKKTCLKYGMLPCKKTETNDSNLLLIRNVEFIRQNTKSKSSIYLITKFIKVDHW